MNEKINDLIEKLKAEHIDLALHSFENLIVSLYQRDLKTQNPELTNEQIEKYVLDVALKRENDVFTEVLMETYWQIYFAGYATSLVNIELNLNEEYKNDLANR